MHSDHVAPIALAKQLGMRPQMVYNYIRAGKIQAQTNGDGRLYIEQQEADRWASEVLAKRKQKKDAIERQLSGDNENSTVYNNVP